VLFLRTPSHSQVGSCKTWDVHGLEWNIEYWNDEVTSIVILNDICESLRVCFFMLFNIIMCPTMHSKNISKLLDSVRAAS